MAAIASVFTIARVAKMLGEDEDRIQALALYMEPEDGRLSIYDTSEENIIAFTHDGVENLRQLIIDTKR